MRAQQSLADASAEKLALQRSHQQLQATLTSPSPILQTLTQTNANLTSEIVTLKRNISEQQKGEFPETTAFFFEDKFLFVLQILFVLEMAALAEALAEAERLGSERGEQLQSEREKSFGLQLQLQTLSGQVDLLTQQGQADRSELQEEKQRHADMRVRSQELLGQVDTLTMKVETLQRSECPCTVCLSVLCV